MVFACPPASQSSAVLLCSPAQSAVLGFGVFRVLQRYGITSGLSVAENVILQTTSVATATMPLAAGEPRMDSRRSNRGGQLAKLLVLEKFSWPVAQRVHPCTRALCRAALCRCAGLHSLGSACGAVGKACSGQRVWGGMPGMQQTLTGSAALDRPGGHRARAGHDDSRAEPAQWRRHVWPRAAAGLEPLARLLWRLHRGPPALADHHQGAGGEACICQPPAAPCVLSISVWGHVGSVTASCLP